MSLNTLSRLGEVTLKDVKAAVDREGNYRYHFKALDPEFGTVKEEVRDKIQLMLVFDIDQISVCPVCRSSWMEQLFRAGKEKSWPG